MNIQITRRNKAKKPLRFLMSLSDNEMLILSNMVHSFIKLRKTKPYSDDYFIYTSQFHPLEEIIVQRIYSKLEEAYNKL
jgi:recombinational DNA repair protein RecR